MLNKLRRPGRSYRDGKFKKIFSTIIFGLICLVFVFIAPMGINLLGEGVVAQVGNSFIRTRELRNLEEIMRSRYKSHLEQADEERALKLGQQIRSQALQDLVSLYLINYALQKEGVFLTDEELVASIWSIPIFQEDGRFLNTRYRAFLKSQNLSDSYFEEKVRREQLVSNWQETFNQAISSNELEEKEKNQARHQYKVSLRYVTLKAEEVAEDKLEPFVQEKNKKEIERFLKTAQVKWEKTGLFSLLLPLGVSIAHSETVIEAVIHQLPSTGLIPQLIRDENKIYIVEVLSFSKENISSEDKQLEAIISQKFEKSNRLFSSWISAKRKYIKVEIKPDQI